MKCPNCGHELSDDETLRFCPRCGRPVDDALSTPEEPALQSETPPAAPAAQPASFMSYVKHPLPWMGLVLYTLVGVTDAERTYPVLFASLVGWLSGAFTIWLYRRVVAAQREKKAHPAPQTGDPSAREEAPSPQKAAGRSCAYLPRHRGHSPQRLQFSAARRSGRCDFWRGRCCRRCSVRQKPPYYDFCVGVQRRPPGNQNG